MKLYIIVKHNGVKSEHNLGTACGESNVDLLRHVEAVNGKSSLLYISDYNVTVC